MLIIRITIFILTLLLLTEISFRVWLYGPASLNPAHMNSFTQIHDSGLVQPAENPAIGYELQPNLDRLYKGTSFLTNSAGLRDQEYSPLKPRNTFRVAVLGSSWTMGSGVEAEQIWHSQLENILNEGSSTTKFELLNFGVDQYGVGEIIATIKDKALAYDPDLIIVALTHYTPTILWSVPPEPYEVRPTRNPFFDLHSLRMLDNALGLGWFKDENSRRKTINKTDLSQKQMTKAYRELARIASRTGKPVVVIKLAYQRGWGKNKKDNADSKDNFRSGV
ncbi:MAG: hypothetical protein ACR2QG_09105, partial [Gammaproteobacteria bacterium]